MVGPEGDITYSSLDQSLWFNFTWDCGVGTGCKLLSDVKSGGQYALKITANKHTGSGLNGLSFIKVRYYCYKITTQTTYHIVLS